MGLEIFRKLNLIDRWRRETEEMRDTIEYDPEDHESWLERIGASESESEPEPVKIWRAETLASTNVRAATEAHDRAYTINLTRPSDGGHQHLMTNDISSGIEPPYRTTYCRSVQGPQRIERVREAVTDPVSGTIRSVDAYVVDGIITDSYHRAVDIARAYDSEPVRGGNIESSAIGRSVNKTFMEIYENVNRLPYTMSQEGGEGGFLNMAKSYLEHEINNGNLDRFEFVRQPDSFGYHLRLRIGDYAVWYDIGRDILSRM